MNTVRIALPAHLRNLAGVGHEVEVDVPGDEGAPTIRGALDALEAAHPNLRGTIREHGGGERRAFMRWFAAGEDLSLASQDIALPESVVEGREPLRIVGAIAGG